jgi:serine/threonine-protein kinase
MSDSSLVGEHLAHFKVAAKLGEGGMGAVFRAEDTKLGRQVALKILPDELATDPERLARFRREAQVLASLNHQNIASIHGIEDADDRQVLVLELVDGEDLADRLKSGPLSLEEAVDIAAQIADGLEAAHDKGIIHRDLKPANLKITPDGTAKVLDFGLAKPYTDESSVTDVSRLATVTGDDMTREGVIMGTASYMSPEQARGRKIDQRADVWAFGCVLFEMLTGRRAFVGETMTDVLVSVVSGEPDWTLLPSSTPPAVRRLLRRCLRRDPRERWRSLGDAALELRESSDHEESAPGLAGGAERPSSALALWALVGPLLGIVMGAVLWWMIAGEGRPFQRQPRNLATVSEPVAVYGAYAPSLAVSPDQRELVYSAGNPVRLYRQMVDQIGSAPVPGAEGALGPFFSPDGRFVGFWADGALKKVPVEGGTPVTLCEMKRYFFGATWAADGFVYFSRPWVLDDGSSRIALVRVPADGGPVEMVAAADSTRGMSMGLLWPARHPDGEHLLVTRLNLAGGQPSIEVVSVVDGSRRTVLDGYQQARFLPDGQLIVGTPEGHVVALEFDLETLETSGETTPVAQGIHRSRYGALHFATGSDGALYWVPTVGASRPDQLVWVDRSGNTEPASSHLRHYETPNLTQDGFAAVSVRSAHDTVNVWILDLIRDTLRPLTIGAGYSRNPVWTPDGFGVVYTVPLGTPELPAGIYLGRLDEQREPTQLVPGPLRIPTSFSPDGEILYYHTIGEGKGWDVWRTGLDGDPAPEAMLTAPYDQFGARAAPGGEWIAFGADAAGRTEIFARRIGAEAIEGQVSPHGGEWPVWSPAGDELFYLSDTHLMSVRVRLGDEPDAEPARELFPIDGLARSFDVSSDGRRFLMIRLGEEPAGSQINVTLDWQGASQSIAGP